MSDSKNAVQRLYDKRLAMATRPFKSRGHKTQRCTRCQVSLIHCICPHKPISNSQAGFCLIMYDDEVLKPSNTGRLIADIVPSTSAYIWSRTEVDEGLLNLIKDEHWFPLIVFPRESVSAQRSVYETVPVIPDNKKPLFILFDGTWREARKMFRKSPYLDTFPIISLPIGEQLSQNDSDYMIRKGAVSGQLATAEVAAKLLVEYGENYNGQLLKCWFDLFSYRYQLGVTKPNKGNTNALANLECLIKKGF